MSTIASPASRCTRLVCSASSPDLACRNQTQSPISSGPRPARSAGSDLAGALEPGQVQARGGPGGGSRSLPVGAAGDETAPGDGDHAAAGAAYDGEAVERRRSRLEAAVVVEQGRDQQARAGGDLGDDRVGNGGLDAARAAGVPELEVDQRRPAPFAISRPALLELGDRGRLSLRTTSDRARWPGT